MTDCSLLLIEYKKYNLAREYLQQVLEIYNKNYGLKHEKLAMTFHNLGWLSYEEANLDKAYEYFLLAYSLKKEIFGIYHEWNVSSLDGLAYTQSKRLNHQSAIRFALKAYVTEKKLFEINTINLIESILTVADLQEKASNYKGAKDTLYFAMLEYDRLGIDSSGLRKKIDDKILVFLQKYDGK